MESSSFFFEVPVASLNENLSEDTLIDTFSNMYVLHRGMGEDCMEFYEKDGILGCIVHIDPLRGYSYGIVNELVADGIYLNRVLYKVWPLFPWNHPVNPTMTPVRKVVPVEESTIPPEPPALKWSYGRHHTKVRYEPVGGLRMFDPDDKEVEVGGPLDPTVELYPPKHEIEPVPLTLPL